jgi:hypothetical protein
MSDIPPFRFAAIPPRDRSQLTSPHACSGASTFVRVKLMALLLSNGLNSVPRFRRRCQQQHVVIFELEIPDHEAGERATWVLKSRFTQTPRSAQSMNSDS